MAQLILPELGLNPEVEGDKIILGHLKEFSDRLRPTNIRIHDMRVSTIEMFAENCPKYAGRIMDIIQKL